MSSLDRCLNVYDLRAAAKRRLPRAVFEFVDRGSEDGVAVANNRNAFERIKLRHRALVDVSGRTMNTDTVRQTRFDADGDRTHRGRRPLLARRRAGTGQGRREGEDPFHAGHRRDDFDGEDRRRGRPRRWRPPVVPALCLEQARDVLPAYRSRASGRVRGADRYRRYHRATEPRVQHAQRLRAAVHAEHDVHAGYHAAPGVVRQGADEVLHHHRHAAQRELPRRIQADVALRSYYGADGAAGFAELG